jgi:hypothetical protein
MSNKQKKKRKLQSNKSYKGETDSDASKSFRINTYFAITDSLLSELDIQWLAYENHNAKFGSLRQMRR